MKKSEKSVFKEKSVKSQGREEGRKEETYPVVGNPLTANCNAGNTRSDPKTPMELRRRYESVDQKTPSQLREGMNRIQRHLTNYQEIYPDRIKRHQ